MKRYFKAFGYLLSVHVLALLVMTLFRLVEFIALHGMIVDAEASRVMAFVKGVWFDNVIACYISVLPVAVLLIAASLGWCHRRLLRGINIWSRTPAQGSLPRTLRKYAQKGVSLCATRRQHPRNRSQYENRPLQEPQYRSCGR